MKIKLLVIIMLLVSLLFVNADEIKKEVIEPEIVKLELVSDTLQATITIPEGMHMAKQEDFVYIEIDSVAGVKLSETIWSKGGHLDELGILNFEKQVILKRQVIAADLKENSDLKLKVFVGYQMWFDTYCEPPKELEFEVIFTR